MLVVLSCHRHGKVVPACGKYVRPLFLYMKHPFLLVWLTLIVLCGCTSSGKQKKHVIGLSQCMLDDAWRQAMINDMRIEASNYDDVEIIIKDAQNNNETQIQQIRDLIRQKVDVLIISPYQSEPITQLPRKRTVPESRRSLQIAR